jgi:ferrous iron transport protein A
MVMLNVDPGRKVRVTRIAGGERRTRKLFEVGIVPGAELELISRHPFKGPLLLKLGNAVLALGRDMAKNIEVEEI